MREYHNHVKSPIAYPPAYIYLYILHKLIFNLLHYIYIIYTCHLYTYIATENDVRGGAKEGSLDMDQAEYHYSNLYSWSDYSRAQTSTDNQNHLINSYSSTYQYFSEQHSTDLL